MNLTSDELDIWEKDKTSLVTICTFLYPKREDVFKALYPILMHPEMIYCPKIQLFNPAATSCAQLFPGSSLCCFPEESHTVPVPVHRQSLHLPDCVFSKVSILSCTEPISASGLKTQNPSRSLKIKSVLQNQSTHSNSCKPDLLSQVSTLLSGSSSDKSFVSLAFFIIVKTPIRRNYMYFAKENKGKIYLPS